MPYSTDELDDQAIDSGGEEDEEWGESRTYASSIAVQVLMIIAADNMDEDQQGEH